LTKKKDKEKEEKGCEKGKGEEEKKEKVESKEYNDEIIEQLRIELNDSLEQLREHKDKYLRALAEMDNLRKRFIKEKAELQKYANEKLILNILPVVDNFERAIKAAEDSDSIKHLLGGVKLILRQLMDILERAGVKSFESVGEKFDPYKHEALLATESTEHDPSTILEEIEKGYLLGDKVIRPAKVTVCRQKEKKEDVKNGN